MRERRSQRRISVGIPFSVILPDSLTPIRVVNLNLSWGGALFLTRSEAIWRHEHVRLIFPWRNGDSFAADAEVLRRDVQDDGSTKVAVRFSSLSRADQSRLERLLRLLMSREDKQSSSPQSEPVVETLEINLADEEEMLNTLGQIATGRLSLTVFGAYRIGQSIRLAITESRSFPGLSLRARIFGEKILPFPFDTRPDLVDLELRFEHPLEDLQHLADLMRSRPQLVPAQSRQAAAVRPESELLHSESVRLVPPSSSESIPAARDPEGGHAISTLEERFSNEVVRLVEAWGDPEYFDLVVSRLSVDEDGRQTEWPLDAWMELMLLRQVHDLAYGVNDPQAHTLIDTTAHEVGGIPWRSPERGSR